MRNGFFRRVDLGKRCLGRAVSILCDGNAYFEAAETASLVRPRARRRLMILRPALVDMRLRKP